MSAFNAAKNRESEAFDDLLGQLVDELAMSPVSAPQPDPAPQVAPAPTPHGQFTPTDFHGATQAAANYAPPRSSSKQTIAIAGIIGAVIVTLGLAAMFILPSDGEEVAAAPAPAPEPVVAPVAAPAPTPPPPTPTPIPVAVPAPEGAETPTEPEPAKTESATEPVKKKKKPTKKKPAKTPPKKKPPKKSGDSFEDL